MEPKTNEELGKEIEALQASAKAVLERVTAASTDEDIKAVQSELKDTQLELAKLTEERDERLRDAERKGMKAQIETLDAAIKDLQESSRVPQHFSFGDAPAPDEKSVYAEGGSFFLDVLQARKGDKKSLERLDRVYGGEGKAMTEGVNADGGFLVKPQIIPGVLELRERPPSITNLIPTLRVNSDQVDFVSITSGLSAGWVAELAEKPANQFTFGTLSASVFTAAGLAVVANQLLADSAAGPHASVDGLIGKDLVKRINNVIAKGIIYGTGTGQPRGILNTSGVNTITYTDATPTVAELLPQILAGITAIQENNLSDPNAIVMRPSTWTKIVSDPSTSPGIYTLGTDFISRARTASDPLPARSLFGYPVVLEPNIPNNLGAGTNQTAVIVGDFSDSLLLEREDFAVDKSEHVYFTSNQTVFRGEQRVGFTAARYPKALSVVVGTGLIGF